MLRISLTKQAINKLKAVINGYKIELNNLNNMTDIDNSTSNMTIMDNQVKSINTNRTILNNNEVYY